MTYADRLTALGEETTGKLVKVWDEYDAGRITRAEAVALMAAVLAAANVAATVLADLGVAAVLTVRSRTPVPVAGLVHAPDVARLNRAADTLLTALEASPDPAARIGRIGTGEPLQRAAEARSEALAESPMVQGWVRSLNGDTCQMCTWWWREGRVWPADHPMPRHTGCVCTQDPVLVERVREVRY